MKKILLTLSVLFLSSASYANNAVESQVVLINEAFTQAEKTIETEKPVLREAEPSVEVKTIVDTTVKEVVDVVETAETPVNEVAKTTASEVTELPVKELVETAVNEVSETTVNEVKEHPVVETVDVVIDKAQQVMEEKNNYNADTQFLLEKIEAFTPIDIEKKVIVKTIVEPTTDESLLGKSTKKVAEEVQTVTEESILTVEDIQEQGKSEDKIATNKISCSLVSADVLKQPKSNLPLSEKLKLKKYLNDVAKKEFSSICCSNSRKSIVRIKVVIDRNGLLKDAKIVESSYNKDFNKQVLQQLNNMQLPKYDLAVDEVVGVYHFDNIKFVDK